MHPFLNASTRTRRLASALVITCLALSGAGCSKQSRNALSPTSAQLLDQSAGSRSAPPPVTDFSLLGRAGRFAVLGGSTVTSTGLSVLEGDLGVSPGTAITGFGPGVVTGTTHAGDPIAAQAQADLALAAAAFTAMPSNATLSGQDLGGLTLAPGVYTFASSAALSGALLLDAQGDANAVWVFQIGSTLTTAVGSSVRMINGGRPCNVFWQVGSSATIGTGTHFTGTIISAASITLTRGVVLAGRALARAGAVTMDTDSVSSANCSPAPVVVPCRQRVTGDGSITVAGAKASFRFDVREKSAGRLKGWLEYVNQATHSRLAMDSISSFVVVGKDVMFTGSGKRDGVAGTYRVLVTDSNNSMLPDHFSISITGGVTESGDVTSGSIRIRDKHCGPAGDDEDDDDDHDGHDGHGDRDDHDGHGRGKGHDKDHDKGGKGGRR